MRASQRNATGMTKVNLVFLGDFLLGFGNVCVINTFALSSYGSGKTLHLCLL